MRLAIYLLVLTGFSPLFIGGPSPQLPRDDCPTVLVSCPDEVARPEKSLTFRAEVRGPNSNAKLKYYWTVSAGTISKGQDTSSITVETEGLNRDPITATVEVSGLPAGCPGKASCTTTVARLTGCSRPFDQYGDINSEDETARLDNFAIQLQEEIAARGFVITYGGRTSFEGQARERARLAKDYLTREYNFVDERIVTIDGGYREDATVELWIVPREATPPTASPTLNRADVLIVEKAATRAPARRPIR
jgi:hypothetical protein